MSKGNGRSKTSTLQTCGSRVAERPIPFCDYEVGLCREDNAARDSCLICCQENPKYIAVGSCGHTQVCWMCSVRLRAILQDFGCPVCKEELQEVMLTADPQEGLRLIRSPAENSIARPRGAIGPKAGRSDDLKDDDVLVDSTLGIRYANSEIREEVERLFDYTCWIRGCSESGRCFSTIDALSQHIWINHNRQFCSTCLDGRKVFLHEQLLYAPEDLQRHQQEGDGLQQTGPGVPPTAPHAHCDFCRKYLHTRDDLIYHMHKRHHLCSICARLGKRGHYYKDFGCLSAHYEEKHFPCAHEDCQRGGFKFMAFGSEEELRLHEASEHASLNTVGKKKGKHGVRVDIQIGARSYREEQLQRQQGQQGWTAPGSRGTSAQSGSAMASETEDVPISFMWSRRPPSKYRRDAGDGERDDQDDVNRYPPRQVPPLSRQSHQNRTLHIRPDKKDEVSVGQQLAAASASAPSPAQDAHDGNRWTSRRRKAEGKQQSPDATAETPSKAGAETTASALLTAAIQKVSEVGLDLADLLEPTAYKERNKHFKKDLQAAFGVDQMSAFKDHSAMFRRSVSADEMNEEAVRTYAESVLSVFAETVPEAGLDQTAQLLSDLVTLLPEKSLRWSLWAELVELLDRKAREANVTPRAKGPSKIYSVTELSPQLKGLPVSCAYLGESHSPCFIIALDSVLGCYIEDCAPELRRQDLIRQVRTLQWQQVESLERLQQHLTIVGGADLDFSSLERVLALRPMLSLKLARRDDGRWHEWKLAAATALESLCSRERVCIQYYVRLCLSHFSQVNDTCHSMPTKDTFPEDFPSLPGEQNATVSSQRMKNGRQRQV